MVILVREIYLNVPFVLFGSCADSKSHIFQSNLSLCFVLCSCYVLIVLLTFGSYNYKYFPRDFKLVVYITTR